MAAHQAPRPWDSPGKNTGVGCHFLLQCLKVKSESEVTQSCPTLRDPIDCSLPGSSIHGIFQARVLEWGAIAFSGPEAKANQSKGKTILSYSHSNGAQLMSKYPHRNSLSLCLQPAFFSRHHQSPTQHGYSFSSFIGFKASSLLQLGRWEDDSSPSLYEDFEQGDSRYGGQSRVSK